MPSVGSAQACSAVSAGHAEALSERQTSSVAQREPAARCLRVHRSRTESVTLGERFHADLLTDASKDGLGVTLMTNQDRRHFADIHSARRRPIADRVSDRLGARLGEQHRQ